MPWTPATPGGRPEAGAQPADLAHRRAMQCSDDLVQQLVVAKYALTVSDIPRAMRALDDALALSRRSLSDLLELVSATPNFTGEMVRTPGPRPAAD